MNGSKFKVKQGAIFLANLNPVKGHEQAGFRPVIVLQNDILNSSLKTTIVAPITSRLKAKGRLTTFFLAKENYNLERDSVVLLYQARCIDMRRLKTPLAQMDKEGFRLLKRQIVLVF